MSNINILPFEIANLIAAGEVVDRPASVVKELVENALDAGATRITCEIKAGGVSLIRVSDNGGGMSEEDLPLSIRRHATSKIRTADDLTGITTLGFRGEALAAIASVCNLTIITKTPAAGSGSLLTSEGGTVTDLSRVGCADGTTVVVEGLFANVPARRKFLKRDRTEAMAVTSLMEKMALSRPDVAFRFLSDDKAVFTTTGDGDVSHALYAINGRAFAEALLPVDFTHGGVQVTGYIGTSDNTRGNRGFQCVFINRRFVRSKTAVAALEEAFTSYMATDRFPVCCLYLSVDYDRVDVNVHPTKMEVRFSDERPVFEAVYWAVRGALEKDVKRPEMSLGTRDKAYEARRLIGAFTPVGGAPAPRQISVADTGAHLQPPPRDKKTDQNAAAYADPSASAELLRRMHRAADDSGLFTLHQTPLADGVRPGGYAAQDAEAPAGSAPAEAPAQTPESPAGPCAPAQTPVCPAADAHFVNKTLQNDQTDDRPAAVFAPLPTDAPAPADVADAPWRLIGVAFDCYVLVECEGELLIIDQHAAHERILFEEFLRQTKEGRIAAQSLLVPLAVELSGEAVAAVVEAEADLYALGYSFTADAHTVSLTEIPSGMEPADAEHFFADLAQQMTHSGVAPILHDEKRRERALYQMACKAAIKGGRSYDRAHLLWLIDRLRALPDVTVCPHGRPVAYILTRHELDRRFDRV